MGRVLKELTYTQGYTLTKPMMHMRVVTCHCAPQLTVDARAVALPEKSPVAATKLSKVKEPHVAKENANAGELEDENPAVPTEPILDPNTTFIHGHIDDPKHSHEICYVVSKGSKISNHTIRPQHDSLLLQVKCVEPNLAQNEENTVAVEEIKEKTLAAAGGENKAVKITDSEKVQREWTCALCQVTATSEKILDSHLQGRKHKAQELKASMQVNKNTDGEINHLQGRRYLAGPEVPGPTPKKFILFLEGKLMQEHNEAARIEGTILNSSNLVFNFLSKYLFNFQSSFSESFVNQRVIESTEESFSFSICTRSLKVDSSF
ncbi:uncharacterized protein LOC131307122 [Rhododendron vialii]|uniref:uncharacterized protein LOC131307122 n=1 Tax=Rhododendron vialii TaxID=182163 RepID=UPI00265D8100|nr:uncharacterized protein LOC131307122 [Rhododendron vialii]